MTPEDVRGRLERVEVAKFDPEQAHTLEDHLWADVLRDIANGTCSDPQSCAAIALQTSNIKFERWCA